MATACWIDPLPRVAVGLDDFDDFASTMVFLQHDVALVTLISTTTIATTSARRVWDPGIDPAEMPLTASTTLTAHLTLTPRRQVSPTVDRNPFPCHHDSFVEVPLTMLTDPSRPTTTACHVVGVDEDVKESSHASVGTALAWTCYLEWLTQWVCGRHMQLIVIQMLGWMTSYAYQRPAIRPTRQRLPTDAFVDQVQVPLLFQPPTVDASIGLTPSALATVKLIFHYAHPVLSWPTVPNINVFRLPV